MTASTRFVPPHPTLLDRIQHTALWRLKERLQFTGWLQFAPPIILGVVLLATTAVLLLVGVWGFWPSLSLALALLAGLRACYEIITLKFGVRPREPIPPPRDRLDAFDLMRSRRSCRSFQARGLTDDHHARLDRSVATHLHTSARLTTENVRLEYAAGPLTVWPVLGAREFYVAIAPKTYSRRAIIDVARALQKVVLDATRAGIATCWIGPGADQSSVVAQLGDRFDPTRDHVVCVCAIGYESRIKPITIMMMQATQHRRIARDELFFRDPGLTEPIDLEEQPFREYGRTFEGCQWSPSSFNAQPTRGAVTADDGVRVDFWSVNDSHWYSPVAAGIWLADWETGATATGHSGRAFFDETLAASPSLPDYNVSWRAVSTDS